MSVLFDWRMVRVDLELVYCNIKTDSDHVYMRPSKAVVILFEELDKCKVKFGVEVCSNLDLVIQKVGMNANIIKFIYAQAIGICVLSQGTL